MYKTQKNNSTFTSSLKMEISIFLKKYFNFQYFYVQQKAIPFIAFLQEWMITQSMLFQT